jgi:hypothetical protein
MTLPVDEMDTGQIANGDIPSGFVGLRPYQHSESVSLVGRDCDASEVIALILAHREVLVHGQSGVGKTSFVNAALLSRLMPSPFDHVHCIRLGLSVIRQAGEAADTNPFWRTTVAAVREGLGEPPSVSYVANEETFPAYWLKAAKLLVFEQFEELALDESIAHQQLIDFLRKLCDLARVPRTKMLIVLRSEFLLWLERFSNFFPEELATRFELRGLERHDAVDGLVRGFRSGGIDIEQATAESVVNQVTSGTGSALGHPDPYVQPVLYQLVCFQLYQASRTLGKGQINRSDIQWLVGSQLVAFYEAAIKSCVGRGISERRLREWLETNFITSAGTRAFVFQGDDQTAGMSNSIVRRLIDAHLIRGEYRDGAVWLQLISDVLIEPIRRSNRQGH